MNRPENIALFLSGGGFRATFFHLGVIRFLRDINQLTNVRHISAVSGGSILAAHLVLNWEKYLADEKSFENAAEEVIRFAQSDPRGHITRRWAYCFAYLGIDLIFPRIHFSRCKHFERLLSKELYDNASLSWLKSGAEGQQRPELHMLATSLITGNCCWFSSNGITIDESTPSKPGNITSYEGELLPLALAVAASAAFPPLFPPIVLKTAELGDRKDFSYEEESLTDGGVFDNLGMRHLQWVEQHAADQNEPLSKIICSDATALFDWETKFRLAWLPARAARVSDVMMKRIADLEFEHFNNNKKIILFSIDDKVKPIHYPYALSKTVQHRARTLRTDLDYFSDLEISTLIAHGYEVAYKNAAQQQLCAQDTGLKPQWVPFNDIDKMPMEQRAATLAGTQRIRSRIFSIKDWYLVLIPLAVVMLITIILFKFWPIQSQPMNDVSVFKALAEAVDEQQRFTIIEATALQAQIEGVEKQRQLLEGIVTYARISTGGHSLKCHGDKEPDNINRCVIFEQDKSGNPDSVIRNENGQVSLLPDTKGSDPCPYPLKHGADIKRGNPCKLIPPRGERLYQTKYEVYYWAHRSKDAENVSKDTGHDRFGWDYRDFTGTPEECQDECAHDAQCKAYAWRIQGGSGHCWLKNDVPPLSKDKEVTSGCKGCNPLVSGRQVESLGSVHR